MDDDLHLAIDLRRAPCGGPSGHVRDGSRDREFRGWLGLIAVLRDELERSAAPPDDLGGQRDP